MRNKKLMLALVIATLLALPLASAFAAEPGDPDTSVQVESVEFWCGQTGTSQILVSIDNDPSEPRPVHGVEVYLNFDPTLLQVVDADGDPYNGFQIAPEDGLFPLEDQIVVQVVDNEAGTILFAMSRQDEGSVHDIEDAVIATITWEAADGVCDTMTETSCSDLTVEDALMSDADGFGIAVDEMLSGNVCVDPTGSIVGSVQLQGREDHSGASIVVTDAEENTQETVTDADGNFVVADLIPGTYTVEARMYGYLDSMEPEVVVVAGEATDLEATKLLGGDVAPQPEPDNEIDILDVSYIGSHFRTDEYKEAADVNSDGVVNIRDLTMAAANFGKACPMSWSETPVPLVSS
jgi:hypothetical protein